MKVAHLAAACALAVLVAGCTPVQAASRAVIALPNGYYLQRDRVGQPQIVNRRGKVIVPGPIAGYSVHRLLVTGLIGETPATPRAYPNDSPLPEASGPQYFVLDTATGHLESGLTAQEWKSRFEALGMTSLPAVRAPILPE